MKHNYPRLAISLVITALALSLTACGGDDSQNQPSPSTSVTAPTTADNPTVGGLVQVLPASQIALPTVPADVTAYYSEDDIKSASEFALAFTYATAYDSGLWEKIIKDPKGVLGAGDVYPWASYFTENGKNKLLNLAPADYDGLFILPSPQAGDEYPVDAIRPFRQKDNTSPFASAKYKVSNIGLGAVAAETGVPTLAVTVEDYEYFDYKNNGKWVGVATKRIITYDLAQTPANAPVSPSASPEASPVGDNPPWLINDWKQQGDIQTMTVDPLVRGEKK